VSCRATRAVSARTSFGTPLRGLLRRRGRQRRDGRCAPRPPHVRAFRPRPVHPGLDTLGDLPLLQLDPGERDVVERFADRRGVDSGLLQRAQPIAARGEGLQRAGAVQHGAEGSVQLPDDDQVDVATASELQQPAPFLAAAQVIGTGVVD